MGLSKVGMRHGLCGVQVDRGEKVSLIGMLENGEFD